MFHLKPGFLEEAIILVENMPVYVVDKLPRGREYFVVWSAVSGQTADFGPFDIGSAELALPRGQFLVIRRKFDLGLIGDWGKPGSEIEIKAKKEAMAAGGEEDGGLIRPQGVTVDQHIGVVPVFI
ncbi:MAG: hypothetical protein ACRD9L_23435, partial [Bryobacteraceae bacterium]